MSKRTKDFVTIICALALVGLTGCGIRMFSDRFKATQELSKSFTTKANPHVVVETLNGKVEVIAGPSEGKVEVKLTKRAGGSTQEDAEERLQDIQTSMEMDGNTVNIHAELSAGAGFSGNRGVDVELQIPQGSVVNLTTSNGKISVTGPTGEVAAHTSNGPIHVKGSQGKTTLRSSNGPLGVESVKGLIDVETSNGKIEIGSSDGPVKAHTSNGSIHFKGKLAETAHSFRTSNGGIELVLPANARFTIDAQTSNHAVDTDFPIQKHENSDRTHLHGSVGDNPAVSITAHTSNGRVKIMQEK